MNKSILVFSLAICTIGAFFTSCNSPAQKVENAENKVTDAQNKVEEAKKDLVNAKEAYLVDIETQRKEAAQKIEFNNQLLTEFKQNVIAKKAAKAEYDKKVLALEQKNNDLKLRMQDYRADGKDNWEKFKIDFNRDMDELNKSFSDLTTLHPPKK